ncbi:hypothetical protein NKR23_g6082 [Pleurostoma richardsiae]|uniref:YjgF-like protein n=1 Tax=Pleurostoma richardsiae TaxID=41990 RepID=A0AA38RQI9_9PEZI|nr:hypothetical protein NKR23_g6082 [Pleurostoma richardsiae]
MSSSIVATVNREDQPPLASTFSALSIVPIPPHKPAVHLLHTAGQVGLPSPSSPSAALPTSFREQAENAFANVAACLALGGATPRDITKITIYVVDYELSMRAVLAEVITAFFSTGGSEKPHAPPSTLLGVAALASKEFLIEVDAEAVVVARPE